jgi:hypothetical protein
MPVKETAEIETGMVAEKFSWDQANIRQKLGLVWRNRKKISQIIKDYFYLPFFLLIIFLVVASCIALSILYNARRGLPYNFLVLFLDCGVQAASTDSHGV